MTSDAARYLQRLDELSVSHICPACEMTLEDRAALPGSVQVFLTIACKDLQGAERRLVTLRKQLANVSKRRHPQRLAKIEDQERVTAKAAETIVARMRRQIAGEPEPASTIDLWGTQ